MKKLTWLLAMVLLSVSISGCQNIFSKESIQTVSSQNKNYVYSFESIKEKMPEHDFYQSIILEDRIIFVEYRYEDTAMQEDWMGEEDYIEDEFYIEEDAIGIEDVEIAEDIAVEEDMVIAEDLAITEDIAVEEDMVIAEDAAIAEEDIAVNAVAEEYAIAVDDVAMPQEEIFYEEDFYMEEEYQPTKVFLSVVQADLQGNIQSEFEVELTGDANVNCFCADKEGNVYLVTLQYGVPSEENPEIYIDRYTLLGYSTEGEEFGRLVLGADCNPEEDYYYVNQMFCNDDGVILHSTSGIELYHKDFSHNKTISCERNDISNFLLLQDGTLCAMCYGNSGQYFCNLNLETGEFSKKVELPFDSYNYSYYAGLTTDLVMSDMNGVYTYNFGEERPVKIMDYVDSDLASNNMYSITQLNEQQFFAWMYDEAMGEENCGIFSKVDPSMIQEKKILTLATIWTDSEVRARVVEFNKNSSEYRIRIEDYNQYNTSEDYTAGTTKLNTDIASGNAPDILCITGEIPVDSYVNKGLFVDLNTFMEKDPELKKMDYLQEVFDAFSVDGKWYQLVPQFYLFTIFGKTSEVGEMPGWTFADLQTLRMQKDEGIAVLSEQTKNSILQYSMMLNSNQYINWEEGECYFNSSQFIELLEFANEFPDSIDYSELYDDPDYWESQETMFRDGRALLMPYSLSGFRDFQYCEDGNFGEQITAVGFPTESGVGNAYSYNLNFAISSKSDYQDIAWEFLRYYLTDEYQDSIQYGWPVKLSSIDKLAQEAQIKPSYTDEEGNVVEYDETFYLGGMEIVMEPLTQEDCERVMTFLKSADHVYSYNQQIMKILEEECAPYFEGQKTVEEVVDIIQSRVYIYVNENL